jgi:hypothetical protein
VRSAAITRGSVQPRAAAAISPYTSVLRPTNASTAPRQSSTVLACGSRLSGTWRSAIQIVATASSGLIRKIARHDT